MYEIKEPKKGKFGKFEVEHKMRICITVAFEDVAKFKQAAKVSRAGIDNSCATYGMSYADTIMYHSEMAACIQADKESAE